MRVELEFKPGNDSSSHQPLTLNMDLDTFLSLITMTNAVENGTIKIKVRWQEGRAFVTLWKAEGVE